MYFKVKSEKTEKTAPLIKGQKLYHNFVKKPLGSPPIGLKQLIFVLI